MKVRHLYVASMMIGVACTSMMSAARADDNAPALSRAEVKAAVLRARANGQLRRTGDAADYDPAPPRGFVHSRADLRAEVLDARAAGELIPAGQAVTPFEQPTVSTMARAGVKAEVRLARLQGELIPAGQGFGPVETVAKAPHRQTFALSTAH